MKKLDKKQIPQFAALCILSAGTFGFFVMRLVTPTPAAAGTRPRPVQEAAKPGSPAASPTAQKARAGTDTASTADAAPVPVPTAGMRDPFVVGYVDPKLVPAAVPAPVPVLPATAKAAHTQMASIHEVGPAAISAPFVPGLPLGLKSFPATAPAPVAGLPSAPPAPVLPAAPAWTVTGVLQNDTQHVAILRNGEARRFVRTGDFVDSQFKVVDVTRSSVTLRHGAAVYHLLLGGIKPASVPSKSTAPVSILTMPVSKPTVKPQSAAAQSASLNGTLTAIYESGLTLAQSCFTAIRTRPAPPAPADQVAMLFPEESPFALDPNAVWPQAQTLNISDADQAAEMLLTRYL
ncbi:MAG: hypothetical protein M3Y13_02540 [Armatimonadota bacterium]|nr:hypothetical protein [Armatimonadota bacterium]